MTTIEQEDDKIDGMYDDSHINEERRFGSLMSNYGGLLNNLLKPRFSGQYHLKQRDCYGADGDKIKCVVELVMTHQYSGHFVGGGMNAGQALKSLNDKIEARLNGKVE